MLDTVTGEVWSQRRLPGVEAVMLGSARCPSRVVVAYEAGPAWFGLARSLGTAGVGVAPSKLERPPGDRVKTDRCDAERLARLLHIGKLPAVRVPTQAELGAQRRRRRGGGAAV